MAGNPVVVGVLQHNVRFAFKMMNFVHKMMKFVLKMSSRGAGGRVCRDLYGRWWWLFVGVAVFRGRLGIRVGGGAGGQQVQ